MRVVAKAELCQDLETYSEMETIKIGEEPVKLQILSEPYVVYTTFGYQVGLMVINPKTKRQYFMYIGPSSLGKRLEELRLSNNSNFSGVEFWVRKENSSKGSKYIVEQ